MLNVHMHKIFIRIGIRKTLNTDDFLGSGTKLLLPSLSLGFRHEERETPFFYADCSSIVSSGLTDSTNERTHPAVHKLDSPRPDSNPNSLRLSPNLNSLLLFKITKNPSHHFRAWRHSHGQFHLLSGAFIVTTVIATSSLRAREHLR